MYVGSIPEKPVPNKIKKIYNNGDKILLFHTVVASQHHEESSAESRSCSRGGKLKSHIYLIICILFNSADIQGDNFINPKRNHIV